MGKRTVDKNGKVDRVPAERPADLSNINGMDEKDAREILEELLEDCRRILLMKPSGRRLIESYIAAAKEHVGDAAEGEPNQKKFRYQFGFPASIEERATGEFLVNLRLNAALKWSDSVSGLVGKARAEAKAKKAADDAPMFGKRTGELTQGGAAAMLGDAGLATKEDDSVINLGEPSAAEKRKARQAPKSERGAGRKKK